MNKDTPQSQRRKSTRSGILLAARHVFEKHGFEKAKTSDVARRAGVAEGTLFLHFESKHGLFSAITNENYDAMIVDAKKILEGNQGDAEKLQILTRYHLLTLQKNWNIAVSVLGPLAMRSHQSHHQDFYQRNREYRNLFSMIIQRLIDEHFFKQAMSARFIRDTLFGSIEYFAMAHFDGNRSYHINDYLDSLWQLLFDGAKTQESSSIENKLDRILNTLNTNASQGDTYE